MKDDVYEMWEAKRTAGIKRFVAAWSKYQDGGDPEPINTPLDAITVAHIAANFQWDRVTIKDWADEEEKAIERFVAAWERLDGDDNPRGGRVRPRAR
jgi:hypothetical protein